MRFIDRLEILRAEALEKITHYLAGVEEVNLTTEDDIAEQTEEFYDLPTVEYVDKHGFYTSYKVVKVKNAIDGIELIGEPTGDEVGSATFGLPDLDIANLSDLADRLAERASFQQKLVD